MKKTILLTLFALFFATGCGALFPYQPGFLYNDSTSPYQAADGATGPKSGEACQTNILGLVGTGDASIAAAAQAGGVQQISTVDTNFMHVLGIFSKTCTTVTGQ